MLDEETQLGLWMNLDREKVRASLPITLGVGCLFGGADENYYNSFVESPEVATLLAFRSKTKGK